MKLKTKKMKLELKHLLPYLPYGLKILREKPEEIMILGGLSLGNTIEALQIGTENTAEPLCALVGYSEDNLLDSEKFKPILRPIEDLDKLIKTENQIVNISLVITEKSLDIWKICYAHKDFKGVELMKYCDIIYLFKWHFDVFGLIKAGLAIDLNALKK